MTASRAATVQVRSGTAQDLAGIYDTHVRSIREVCASHYSPADIAACADRLYPGIHARAMRAHVFQVAVVDGRVAGFGQLDVERSEVEAIYVHPDFLRRGVGRSLLAVLEEKARGARLSKLALDASLNAVPFYSAAGFQSEGDAAHVLEGGFRVPCVRMVKVL